jgi:hypothetical protein
MVWWCGGVVVWWWGGVVAWRRGDVVARRVVRVCVLDVVWLTHLSTLKA